MARGAGFVGTSAFRRHGAGGYGAVGTMGSTPIPRPLPPLRRGKGRKVQMWAWVWVWVWTAPWRRAG